MVTVCTKCGKEITIDTSTPGLFYARCNRCCSLDVAKANHVYGFLSRNKYRAIQQMKNKGLAKDIPDEIYRKKCLSENPTVDSVFGSFPKGEKPDL